MKNKSLENIIKKKVSLRLVLSLGILITLFVFQTVWETKRYSKNKEKQISLIAKSLVPYITSQMLIDNPSAVSIKLRQIENRINAKLFLFTKPCKPSTKLQAHKILFWEHCFDVTSTIPNQPYSLIFQGNYLRDNEVIYDFIFKLVIILVLYALIIFILFPIYNRLPRELIINPIQDLLNSIRQKKESAISSKLPLEVIELHSEILSLLKEAEENSKELAFVSLAKQMAHDIRSPVLALDTILRITPEIPNDKLAIINSAISRIVQISENNINSKKTSSFIFPQMIGPILNDIIQEKYIEYRQFQLNFIVEYNDNQTALLNISNEILSRILSNIFNNAIEASTILKTTKIILNITVKKNSTENFYIDIKDHGCGIPLNKIDNIFDEGVSLNKENGKGLGLYFCKNELKKINGDIHITNSSNQGTTFRLSIPKYDGYNNIVTNFNFTKFQVICCLDDENVVHQSLNKIALESNNLFSIASCRSYNELKIFIQKNQSNEILYLIDYDIKDPSINGIDIITTEKISDQSILLTGHYNDKSIFDLCVKNNLYLLPKSWMAYIINFSSLS